MKKGSEPEEGGGESAPLWMISFADMISLLMAFFVMLQTLASEHTNELFTTGRGRFEVTMNEFQRNIDGFGIPDLIANITDNRAFKSPRLQYTFDSPDTQPVAMPASNGDEEKLRRVFTKLSQSAKTDRPQLTGKIQDSIFLPVQFTSDGSQLDSDTLSRLTRQAAILQESGIVDDTIIYYVVGQAPDLSLPSEQWLVSENRAKIVAEFLGSVMPESLRDNIYWWGAGAGGAWFASAKNDGAQNHVLIVTLVSSSQ
jgi:outer membrane protein OmpA-like peptidoglycan-associated protein